MPKLLEHKRYTPIERLLLALSFVLAVVAVGTAGFITLEKRSFLDALYLTLATISTLGMKTQSQAVFSQAGKIWIMFLIVVGIVSAMIALSTIASMIIEGQVRSILGRRKVNIKIASLHNHFIIAGYGRMGRSLCSHLHQSGASLVIVDQDSQNTVLAEQDGFLYVLGDATEETVLRDAGIERARGLVAALSSDAENVFATLMARDLNPKLFIAARAEKIESEKRLLRAGANKAICPLVIGARRLANILTRPGVVDFIDFATEGFELEAEQFHIESDSKLIGQSLSQANLPRQVGILVVALRHKDGSTSFNPRPDSVIQDGDTLLVIGQLGSMAKLQQLYS
jgi:voltage-gated potassium channel